MFCERERRTNTGRGRGAGSAAYGSRRGTRGSARGPTVSEEARLSPTMAPGDAPTRRSAVVRLGVGRRERGAIVSGLPSAGRNQSSRQRGRAGPRGDSEPVRGGEDTREETHPLKDSKHVRVRCSGAWRGVGASESYLREGASKPQKAARCGPGLSERLVRSRGLMTQASARSLRLLKVQTNTLSINRDLRRKSAIRERRVGRARLRNATHWRARAFPSCDPSFPLLSASFFACFLATIGASLGGARAGPCRTGDGH